MSKGKESGAPGRALTTKLHSEDKESVAYESRTAPPIGPLGERLTRFRRRADGVECESCGCVAWDVWMSEGATSTAAKCVACGSTVDDVPRVLEGADDE